MDDFELMETDIQFLIIRYLDGTASDEEVLRLQGWLGQSEKNFSLFIQFREHWLKAGGSQRYDAAQAWYRLDKRLENGRGKRPLRFWIKISGYAAAVLLFLSLGIYFLESQRSGVNQVAVQNTIEPGSKKAVLVLGTNRQVVLGENIEDSLFHGNSVVKNQDNTLVYAGEQQSLDSVEFNRLITPRGGEYSVVLSDGTKVWLNSESELKYPVNFTGAERKVYLKGEAYFSVTKQGGQTFVVCSDDARITVLGTEFNVRNYKDEAIAATLVKGSIVASHDKGGECKLVPGQQAVFGTRGIEVRNVETIHYTAWKDGYFVYQDKTLNDIMTELSRWYDFTYFYENSALENMTLTAKIRKFDSVEQIFEILSGTGRFGFTAKGKAVTVVAK